MWAPRYVLRGLGTGALGLRVRYDLVPLSLMIEKVVSPHLVVLVDR